MTSISKNCSGQYFVSILVDLDINKKIKTNKNVGVDLGLKHFATYLTEKTIENPRYFRENQSVIAKIQKYMSHKKKGSSRYRKNKLRDCKAS